MPITIADLFEKTAAAVPDRLALVVGPERLTFSELDERANRFASGLRDRGIGTGDHVGIHGMNSAAWVVAMLGVYKLRAVPINVNFRYVTDELAYVYTNANLAGVVLDRQYAPLAAAVIDRVPQLHSVVWIDDGSGAPLDGLTSVTPARTLDSFDELVAQGDPAPDFEERSPDDLYVLYTGGTTGMPKGVMWRQEDVIMALGGGIDAVSGERITTEDDLARRAAESETPLVFLMLPPLMHGAGQWGMLTQMYIGNRLVFQSKFDARAAWDLIAAEGVNSVILTGDAMARPMIEALEAMDAAGDTPDTSSLISISSTAAIFSATVKDRYLERFPHLFITDSIGSTETGFNGLTMVAKGETQLVGGGPTVQPGPDVVILDEEWKLIPEGDDRTGYLGRGGNIPLGYYGDPAKTAKTFVTAADGRRYAVPGDFARWSDDGRIVLLGRGSTTINSGGEKIHPEEVEQALKDHPAVYDCLVVGVPDERWGQRVAAVVQFREGHEATLDELAAHGRTHLSSYKMPRELHPVDAIVRSPSGKPDYPWAQRVARGQGT